MAMGTTNHVQRYSGDQSFNEQKLRLVMPNKVAYIFIIKVM